MPHTHVHSIDVPGARLHVASAGQGEPIVMLHGFLVDSGQWDREFAELAPEARVLRYDARGFGRSSIEPGQSYAHHADLAAVLDACGIDRAVLLGCSGGAATALDFALTWPRRVSGLVLVGAGYWGKFASATPAARAFLQALETFDTAGLIDSSMRAFTDGPRRRPDEVDAAVRRHTLAMTRRVFQRPASYWTRAAQDQRTPQPGALERLGEITAPTRLLVGSEDQPEVHALSRQLARGMPDATFEVLPGAGHHANMEAPAAVLAAVRGLLSATPAQPV